MLEGERATHHSRNRDVRGYDRGMVHHGFDTRRSIALTLLSCALLTAAACGDDSSTEVDGEGCSNDAQCKGDRICVDRQCVDPQASTVERDGGAAGTSPEGEAGRSSGAGGGSPPRAGSGAAGSSAPQAGREVIDDTDHERACSLNCEARHAAECTMNIGSLDQCLAQCLVIDEGNWGYCHPEQTDQYACLASGGYTCVSGYPQPKSTCISESQALAQVAEIADCVGRRNHDCDGFCWAAETLGCGSESCVADCKAKADELACGHYYDRVLDCAFGSHALQMSCEDGTPTPGMQCMSAITDYENCLAME